MSISCGIKRWIAVSISNRKDNKIVVRSENLKSEIIFNLELKNKPTELWHKYVFGSLNIFSSRYQLKKGLNIIINGNVPIGSGLSSSAALEVALLSSYFNLFNIEIDNLELAKLCQKIEHEYLLIDSGLLDQFSSIYAKNDYYTLINFEDLNSSQIIVLGENGIKCKEDLANLDSAELYELLNKDGIENEEDAGRIIMSARAHWFVENNDTTDEVIE